MPPRCTETALCPALTLRLQPDNDDPAHGFTRLNLINVKTGDDSVGGVVYRKFDADRGVLLNYCPWCGAPLNWLVSK